MHIWHDIIDREEARITEAENAIEHGEWPSNRRTPLDEIILHELVPFDPMRVDVFIRYHENLR